jgi:hypothetical protein
MYEAADGTRPMLEPIGCAVSHQPPSTTKTTTEAIAKARTTTGKALDTDHTPKLFSHRNFYFFEAING